MIRAMTSTQRAVAGATVMVLLFAVGYLGVRIAFGAFAEARSVEVAFGETGQGLVPGSDVKMRGVIVGEVGEIELADDYRAIVTLELDPRYEVPERSTFQVTGKTLLGEKQVEIFFDGPFDEGPFLAEGERVDDPSRVVEFEDVLSTLAELMEAIDTDELAIVFDELFGAFEGMGPDIARSVDAGAAAASTFAASLDDQVANTRNLALVMDELRHEADEFNRLGRAVERGMPTLSENQDEIRALLDELGAFSRTLDVTFRVTRPDLDRMMVEGDNVLRLLFAYRPEVGELVTGLREYTALFPEGFQAPGVAGQAARFQIILDTGFFGEFCESLPEELASELPACGAPSPPLPVPDQGDLPDLPIPELPLLQGGAFVELPRTLVAPESAPSGGLDEVLRRSLGGEGR